MISYNVNIIKKIKFTKIIIFISNFQQWITKIIIFYFEFPTLDNGRSKKRKLNNYNKTLFFCVNPSQENGNNIKLKRKTRSGYE